MFFEGCSPDLGCSLVLQGGDKPTLTKVKAIMKYLIYVAYHLKLENKFLMDEFALPPTLDNLLPHGCVQDDKTKRAVFKIAEEDLEEEEEEEEAEVEEEEDKEDDDDNDDDVQNDNDKCVKAKLENNIIVEKCPNTKEDDMLKESKKFGYLISKVLLSSSPFCVYSLPYLLTDEGRKCRCRRFIPGQLYLSKLLNDENIEEKEITEDCIVTKVKQDNPDLIFKEPHAFTQSAVIPRPQDQATKSLLADFRARGGVVDLKTYRDFEELHKERRKEVNIKTKDEIQKMMKKEDENEVFAAAIAKKDKEQNFSLEDNDKKVLIWF